MKKFIFSVTLMLMVIPTMAQDGPSLANRFAIQRMKMEQTNTPFNHKVGTLRKTKKITDTSSATKMAFARLAEGVTLEDVQAQDVQVVRTMGPFVIIATTLDDAERVASLKLFEDFQFEKKVQQKMNYARKATHVDEVHQGIGLTQAYTGKGIVCGIVDNGFDFGHANFQDAEGKPRIKYFESVGTNSNATSADDYFTIKSYNTPEAIQKLTTDNTGSYHGTHTMGIMAGGYRGNTKAALMEEGSDKLITSVSESTPNPYYGMAYDADIIAGAGVNMSNLEIAQAVFDLALYEDYSKQPVVINLSLGSNSGPHDGTSAECQVFDLLAKQYGSKIVIASGNEGDMKLAIHKQLTSDDTEMKSFVTGTSIQDKEGSYYMRYGGIEIYSNDNRPFKELDVIIYNTSRNRISKTFKLTPTELNKGTGTYFCSEGYTDYVGGTKDLTFDKYFEGWVGYGWSIDENSNRAYALIDIAAMDNDAYNKDNQYIIGFKVIGEDGQRFDAYASGDAIYGIDSYGVEGWDDGSCNGTISDMATGQNTLCVGSYTEVNGWPQLDGYSYSQLDSDNNPVLQKGKVSSFTSFGSLVDGRNLPHVLGPGAYVISSMNRHYLEAAGYTGSEDILTAVALNDTRDPYAWSAGTSMACPAVTGIIALWLEADPTLTMDEIKDIIATTSHKTDDMILDDPAQVGYGLIDAYAGLKEVLRRKGADGISSQGATDSRLVATACGDRRVNVFVAGEKALDIEVYDMAGIKVKGIHAQGDEAMIDLTDTTKGAYIIRVNGRLSKCILVK
ncbi:MAG: S8 family peptidase [Bacteroidaceae bacterium]